MRTFPIIQELQAIFEQSNIDVIGSHFTSWGEGEKYIMRLAENDDEEALKPISDKYGTYDVSFSMFPHFEAGLAKVNKTAAKLGVPPLTIASKKKITLRSGKIDYNDGLGGQTEKPAVFGWEITLEGEPVRINGWEFLASLEHGSEKGNNIRYVPGKEDPRVKSFANASNKNCDFCHSNRDRNNTYIIKHIVSGELKQVGGQCLQKHIGDNARKLAKFAFHMDAFVGGLSDDEGSGGTRGKRGLEATDVQSAVAAAIATIEKYGFVRASGRDENDYRTSTVSIVSAGLFHHGSPEFIKEYKDILAKIQNLTADDLKKADDVIDWFNALPDDAKESSYMISLESTINSDMVTPRSMGLIVSLPAVYYRATAADKPKADKIPSNWVGNPGGKLEPTEITVVHTGFHDNQYGTVQLVKMKDDKGNMYTWWNSSKMEMKNDMRYVITGTVKGHDEYKGDKITTLIRVKAREAAVATP
jgi:hypothetical protein